MHRPGFADQIHGHALPADDGGWWLQYWFFYLFNNKAFLGFGLHEGDWEMVQLRLAADGRPRAMAFAQHQHGQRCDWGTVEKLGERPVVYVARGSQASFATAGRHEAPIVPDYADGRGPELARQRSSCSPTLNPPGSPGPAAGARRARATGSSRTARAAPPTRTSGPTRRPFTRRRTRSGRGGARVLRRRDRRRRRSPPGARAIAP